MRAFREPSGIGTNLLNKGAMKAGNSQSSKRLKAIQANQAHSHQSAPSDVISHTAAVSTPPPSTRPSSEPLSVSAMNSFQVIWLKPNLASITKLRYAAKGKSRTDNTTNTTPAPSTSIRMLPALGSANAPAQANTVSIPPASVSQTSTPALNTSSIKPKASLARV